MANGSVRTLLICVFIFIQVVVLLRVGLCGGHVCQKKGASVPESELLFERSSDDGIDCRDIVAEPQVELARAWYQVQHLLTAATPRPPAGVTVLVEERRRHFTNTSKHFALSFVPPGKVPPPPQELRILRLQVLLAALHEFFVSINVSYWLDYGTLLGAWRNQSIIPWDNDADIGVLSADLDRVSSAARVYQRFPFETTFIVRWNYSGIDIPFMMVDNILGCYIDIFSYRSAENALVNVATSTPVEADFVFPLRSCMLAGQLFFCPGKTEQYLLKMYTDLSPPVEYLCWQFMLANASGPHVVDGQLFRLP
eukprot:TRINITY_DN30324_c0_g1_i1.p1 TRINITY_DN30324_c0_g1~~TRINITY_DN30324_c0_g1_i1.p1  ORF type:complete len:310 (+),score=42.98 TRINITY_DN30324_c0_g1_i1:37-966(+)